ncbi:hypothetical protein DdX_21700 [Ditylenchus destructor]|uniref:Uncharacterized protein n=1 Tax=Ditylenchus destructor TaxID=166010 RepID=A0AAD4MEL8_9BILA|nr:hypothetical protein DdX_21700 [Ditylenchus destructor]
MINVGQWLMARKTCVGTTSTRTASLLRGCYRADEGTSRGSSGVPMELKSRARISTDGQRRGTRQQNSAPGLKMGERMQIPKNRSAWVELVKRLKPALLRLLTDFIVGIFEFIVDVALFRRQHRKRLHSDRTFSKNSHEIARPDLLT